MTHITIVSRNKITVSAGVISTGSAESEVTLTTNSPMRKAMAKPATALNSACAMMTVWR
jgi:hypothetical protein